MYMYVYVCMLAIAGKTGGPNGLNFFRDFSSTSGVTKASIFFSQFDILKIPRATPGTLASFI